jgi:hypothetical protein
VGHWWLTSIIQATQEADIRRIVVRSQPGQIVLQRAYLKKTLHKNMVGGVAQGEGPELNPTTPKKKKKKKCGMKGEDTGDLGAELAEDLV